MGIEGEDAEVVLAGLVGLVEFLGVEVAKKKMGAGGIGMDGEEFFEFVGGIVVVFFLLENPGEGVAGVGGVGLEFEGLVKRGEGGGVILGVDGNEAEGKGGLEVGGIDVESLGVVALGVVEAEVALGFDAFLEITLGVSAIARNRGDGQGIGVAGAVIGVGHFVGGL